MKKILIYFLTILCFLAGIILLDIQINDKAALLGELKQMNTMEDTQQTGSVQMLLEFGASSSANMQVDGIERYLFSLGEEADLENKLNAMENSNISWIPVTNQVGKGDYFLIRQEGDPFVYGDVKHSNILFWMEEGYPQIQCLQRIGFFGCEDAIILQDGTDIFLLCVGEVTDMGRPFKMVAVWRWNGKLFEKTSLDFCGKADNFQIVSGEQCSIYEDEAAPESELEYRHIILIYSQNQEKIQYSVVDNGYFLYTPENEESGVSITVREGKIIVGNAVK